MSTDPFPLSFDADWMPNQIYKRHKVAVKSMGCNKKQKPGPHNQSWNDIGTKDATSTH